MFSMGFTSQDARAEATDHYYLNEIARQAQIAALNIRAAIMTGCATINPHDPPTWGALQTTMFSTICIARLLKPGSVKREYPGLSKRASQRHADARGAHLRSLLEVENNSFILNAAKVRNAFEHYDEHIDSRFVGGAECFSDWYITDGNAFKTPAKTGEEPRAVGMRVFFPAGGMLYFEDEALDLFELELELIAVKQKVEKIEESRTRHNERARFGGHTMVKLMSEERVQQRFNEWERLRSQALNIEPGAQMMLPPEQPTGEDR